MEKTALRGLQSLCSLPDIITMMKSETMGLVEELQRVADDKYTQNFNQKS
jgi:hypothetical protein